MSRIYLALANGMIFPGESFGAECESVGELVFTTGMCGYLETLTDPSYAGQIVMQTFPLIGNYGVIESDFEGECLVRGYVVREWCREPSNFRCQYALDKFLKDRGIPAICGVDTRCLTRIIREHGVMNAKLCAEPPESFDDIAAYTVSGVVPLASCAEPEVYPAEGEQKYSVALIDYGAKRNIVRSLTRRGCRVTVMPAASSAEQVLSLAPDGIMLSNGPGDPEENVFQVEQIKKLLGKVPLFGICLGHQLTALAAGGSTFKLKYGHRGVNQPVREAGGARTYITSQNHGYAVDGASVKRGRVSFINANDGTCEGVDYPDDNAFTVQFHPEACSGPLDTGFLFDRFMDMMGGNG